MAVSVELREGFTVKTIIAMIFSAIVLMPALLWVYLSTGVAVGSIAAAYATMLIFGEFGLLFMSPFTESELVTIRWGASMAATFAGGFLFGVYLRKSSIAHQFGVAQFIPTWSVPKLASEAIQKRIIWHPDWAMPFLVGYTALTLSLIGSIALSFVAEQLFIEVERLPFPTGALAAEIAVSIAGGEKRRYEIFAVSTLLAATYETIRSLVPALGLLLFGRELTTLPLIHFDLTRAIEPVLPGATTGLTTNILIWGLGFIIPEAVILWYFITSVFAYVVLPPIFVKTGFRLYPYTPGRPMLIPGTILGAWYEPSLKFWLSIAVGLLLASAIIPTILGGKHIGSALKAFFSLSSESAKKAGLIPGKTAIFLFIFSMIVSSVLAYILTPMGPYFFLVILLITLGYSFLNTIIGARSLGLTGGAYTIPYLNEVTFWLTTPSPSPQSVYSYWVWFNPFIMQVDGSGLLIGYKAAKMTRTKLTSIVKAHVIGIVLTQIVGLVIAGILWNVYDVPSRFMPAPSFPANALIRCMFITRSFGGFFRPDWIVESFIVGSIFALIPRFASILAPYTGLSMLFGMVGGLMDMPSNATGVFVGYLIKKLIEKKMGREWSNKYIMTVAAGIWSGSSIVISLATALRFIRQAIAPEIY